MGFLSDFLSDNESAFNLAATGGLSQTGLIDAESLETLRDPGDIFGLQGSAAASDAELAQLTAIERAIFEQRRSTELAQGFLSPFGDIGRRGVDLSGFLADDQAQFDWLQNNPLFQSSLNLLDRDTAAAAASGGRLNAGDTALRFQNNAMLAATPLIDRQRQDINNLLNIGTGIATTQANVAIGEGTNVSGLLTDVGNVQSAADIAEANRRAQGTTNAFNLAGAIFGASDPRLKTNIKSIGKENGFNIWSWDWNELAKEVFNLIGSSTGVMYPEVLSKQPSATTTKGGFGLVNYDAIGVTNGY